jgi:hypothetical protein
LTEHWVAKLRAHLNKRRFGGSTIKGYLGHARLFLAFLDERGVPIQSAKPSDIAVFVSNVRQQYRRRHGRYPRKEVHFRGTRTAAIHALLTVAQGCWPPLSDIERQLNRFRKRMRRDEIVPTTQQQYTWALREFLLFLEHRRVRAADVDRQTVSAFLEERLEAYRREHRRKPPKMGEWRRRYLSGISRYLRQVQAKWPSPVEPEPEIDEYRDHLRSHGLAESTMVDYCLHARIFLDFIRGMALPVESVEPKDVEAYSRVMVRMYRKQRPHGSKGAASCRAVGLRCVRNFLRFRRGTWPPHPSPSRPREI